MNNIKIYFTLYVLLSFGCGLENRNVIEKKSLQDTTVLILDVKEFQKEYQTDLASINQSLENEYNKISDSVLMDSIYKYLGWDESYKINHSLACNLLVVGIKRNVPDAYAVLGGLLTSSSKNCICECDDRKGINYILKAVELNSVKGLRELKIVYEHRKLYKHSQKILINLSEKGDGLAAYELYEYYSKKLGNIDSLQAFQYLDKAINMGNEEAMFEKANLLKANNEKKEAFEIYMKIYEKYKTHKYIEGNSLIEIEEFIKREFPEEWKNRNK